MSNGEVVVRNGECVVRKGDEEVSTSGVEERR